MDIIVQTVHALGIPSTYHGFFYVTEGVRLASENEDILLSVCRRLYPAIAEKYNTSPCAVESGIRTVVKTCWERGNHPLLNEIFHYPLSEKPTVSEFIDSLTTYCKAKS